MAEDYDIAAAVRRIEDEVIASMIRNLDHHRAEEDKEGINWEQWQVKQLAALEEYKKRNAEKYGDIFDDINARIESLIKMQRAAGHAAQEIAILKALQKGAKLKKVSGRQAEINARFFLANDRKINALIQATKADLQKAEYAILRMANDKYRKIIFDAQMYAASGAGTYESAVDMATKDFLRAGINCVEYSNGARHTASDYVDMAIRTASKRAYLTGEGESRRERGITTVIMNKRGNACPKCLPFVGKVLIDDVWSGGSSRDGPYPLMSTAIAAGLYHPRCKDIHSTYFPGISTPPDDVFTKKELEDIETKAKKEAERQYAKRQAENCDRLAKYSLDKNNRKAYAERAEKWDTEAKKSEESKKRLQGGYEAINDRVLKVLDNNLAVKEILSFKQNGITHNVDGVHAILDYSSNELQMAELLAKLLKTDVSMVPRVMIPQNVSTADFIINNRRYDLKSPTGCSKNLLFNILHKKKRQAENFIIDISQVNLSEVELNRQAEMIFENEYTKFIDEIILIKDEKIIGWYKR